MQILGEFANVNSEKIRRGSPLLVGDGLINISEFCDLFELEGKQALQEIWNNNIPVYVFAKDWDVYHVESYLEVEREDNGGFVLDDAIQKGIHEKYSGPLIPLNFRYTLESIISAGVSPEETAFRIRVGGRGCLFTDLPGIDLIFEHLFINKVQAEALRSHWASVIPAPAPTSMLAAASVSISSVASGSSPAGLVRGASAVSNGYCNSRFVDCRVSEFLEGFIEYNSGKWTEESRLRMRSMIGLFIELMDDPLLGAVDREFVRAYVSRMKDVPANRDVLKKKLGTSDVRRLIALAGSSAKRMSDESVRRHIDKLSQFFKWLTKEGKLERNPAEAVIPVARKTVREQDKRSLFSVGEMELIFSCQWFNSGTDVKNDRGWFSYYRPYQYWLPLLAIYTGGRINELSQLYLADLCQCSGSGIFYVDFNLVGAGKSEKDASDRLEGSDKSLKTVDSTRVVPLHKNLVDLGFVEYVEALRKAGYDRLFPELKHDRIKGYGKPATSFFNERFFGKRLGIARDGTKTFHSFRHMFITKLWDLDFPEHIIAQLAGHARGTTQSARNYRKDAEVVRLMPFISQLSYELPVIHRFNIGDGLIAVKSALLRKRSGSS